jgi:hypothetical protein
MLISLKQSDRLGVGRDLIALNTKNKTFIKKMLGEETLIPLSLLKKVMSQGF